jgi:hypothetical protein
MDNCGMQRNKKQECTGTDIDRRGGWSQEVGRRLASTWNKWGKGGEDDDEGGK